MIQSLYAAASGMAAQQANIDIVSNNLANVNTSGYKEVRAEFADLLYQQLGQGGSVEVGAGTRLAATHRQFRLGNLAPSDNPLDLAIGGDGFFRLRAADGSEVYTRDGAFGLNAAGMLVNHDGLPVLGDNGPITLPQGAQQVEVKPGGEVLYLDAARKQQVAGTIRLATFANPAGLMALGNNQYAATTASGAASAGKPGDPGVGELQRGMLETSNVEVTQQMVALIVAQRTYELNSKAVQSADEMLGIANNLRR